MNIERLNNKYISFEEYIQVHHMLERKDIYISPEWLKILKESYRANIYLLLTSSDSRILAVTPLLVRDKFTFKFIGSPLKGFYSDFMGTAFINNVPEDERTDIINSVIGAIKKLNPIYSEFRFKEGKYSDLFVSNGYEISNSYTSIIETNRSKEELWNRMESRARNMIRKAEKNLVKIEYSKCIDFDVKAYYQLLIDTFKRQNTILHHPKDFFLNLINEKNSKYVIPVVARVGEEIISAAIFLRHEETLFYLSGVSTPLGNQLSASSLIQWSIISHASENGITYYDMGGLGIPSIDKFKMSFGGYTLKKIYFVKKSFLLRNLEPLANWLLEKGIINFK